MFRKKNKLPTVQPRFQNWNTGWGQIVIKEMHNEHNENAGTIAKLRTINKNIVRDIFRKFFMNRIPFEYIPNHIYGGLNRYDWKRKVEHPFPMPNYFRENKQQQNFKNCLKNKSMEFGRKHDIFVNPWFPGKVTANYIKCIENVWRPWFKF